MKHCNIVQDLLPLYQDQLCSEDSECLVLEHLKECPKCRAVLESLRQPEPPLHPHPDDEKLARAASAAWKKRKRKSFLRGSLAVILIAGLLVQGYCLYWAWFPRVILGVAVGTGEDYYMEHVMIVEIPHLGIEAAPAVHERSQELWKWNDDFISDMSQNYTTPKDIRLTGALRDGKTTLRYSGYATNLEGERVEIHHEKTFDFIICRKKDFLTRR